MRIAGPGGWALAGTMALVIIAVLVWGFLGSIPTHVEASGILGWSGGGVRQVVARAEGQLVEVLVGPGEAVAAEQPLARLVAPVARQGVDDATRKLEALRADRERTRAYFDDLLAKEQRVLEQVRRDTRALLDSNARQIAANEKIVQAFEALLRQHYTTSVEVEGARERLAQIRAQQDQNRQRLADLEVQQLTQVRQRAEAIQALDLQILAAEEARADAQLQLELGATLRSPLDGRIVEVLVAPGSFVAENAPVVLVEFGQPTLHATLFLPAGTGKQVAPGMPANVAPATVERAQYGTLTATVAEVAPYPATPEQLEVLLGDKSLVEATLARGPVLVASAGLVPDPAAPSGYRWSSGTGPRVRLTGGTLASATVTVRTQPPIALVVPAIRRLLGLYP